MALKCNRSHSVFMYETCNCGYVYLVLVCWITHANDTPTSAINNCFVYTPHVEAGVWPCYYNSVLSDSLSELKWVEVFVVCLAIFFALLCCFFLHVIWIWKHMHAWFRFDLRFSPNQGNTQTLFDCYWSHKTNSHAIPIFMRSILYFIRFCTILRFTF